jgi:dolichyl-phosphate-mannose-protein mannosyltransferase
MACLFITLIIYFSYYYLFSVSCSESTLRKILLSLVMCCAQIIISELLLGLFGYLYLANLIIANLLIVFSVLLTGHRFSKSSFCSVLKDDMNILMKSLEESKNIYNISLGALVLLTYSWILTASYYLPPRGIDDLAYHLPTIFEYIQSHEIRLLPIELRQHFAFPENAELLFMWPTIFSGSQRLVDSVNIPFVFLSILAVYALFRHFDISRNDALFASMLYALCPVVIFQAGVNYIDIIVSLFFLLSLYFSLLFHSSRKIIYLFAAAISVGLMLGMKYTALLLALPLQLLIISGLLKVKWREAVGYFALIVVLCGWWYARNFYLFNDPFYPLNFLGPLLGNPGGGDLSNNIVVNLQHWLSRYLIEDTGIGSYDGGFGLVFWGIGFSSWLYFVGYSLVHAEKTGLARYVVLAYLPVGFILLLAVPEADVLYVGRLAMFVVAIGLFSFCETMKVLNDKVCASILKIVSTVLCIISLSLLFVSIKPHYDLANVIYDRLRRDYPSEFKYISNGTPRTVRAVHGFVWESLDFLTRDDRTGLYCYIITDALLFSPAPVYGSKLQNRVAYSHKEAQGMIEAYVCTYYPGFKNVRLDDTTSSYDIIANSDYVVVSHWDYGCLILHKKVFHNPDKQQLLAKYYKRTWPEAVTAATQIAPVLNENIPVITSSQIGYGLRYIDMCALRTERVVMTPKNLEEKVAINRKIDRCYSLNKPLSGYGFSKISRVVYNNAEIDIYLNRKL